MSLNSQIIIEGARRDLDNALNELIGVCKDYPYFTRPLTYLLGALYSLRKAQQLGIPDRILERSFNDPTDLVELATELAQGKVRTEGQWVQGYWVNSAAVRTAASFERICKAIGYTQSTLTGETDRADSAKRWFEGERNRYLRGQKGDRATELGTVWDSVNTQKHEFTAPDHRFVASVNEFTLVRALTHVLSLASGNIADISAAYEEIARMSSSGKHENEQQIGTPTMPVS